MLGTIQQASFAELLGSEAGKHGVVPHSVSFPAGHFVFAEGDPGDGLYVIDEGSADITNALADHRRRVLSTLGAGEFFGEMALADDLPRSEWRAAKLWQICTR